MHEDTGEVQLYLKPYIHLGRERQTDRQTDRERQRERDRERQTDRQRE